MRNLPDTAKIEDHHLIIGGCDTTLLAKEFGTPLYVMDEATLRRRCQEYVKSFRKYHTQVEIAYACKALCTAGILKIIAAEGLSLDVSSGGEIYTALKAGCDPQKLFFHGNTKTPAELKMALEAGVGRFMVDTMQEIVSLDAIAAALGKKAQVMLRINPGIDAHTHDYIKTGMIDSKFGVPQKEIEAAVKEIRNRSALHLTGFHAHIGSQIFDVKPFIDELKLLIGLAEKYGVREIGMGGGLGIAYLNSDDPMGIENFAEQIGAAIQKKSDLRFILEPGRSIVGTAGTTLYTVGGIKEIPGIRKYILVDGGMSDNPRPILYQAKYDAKVANKADLPPAEKVTIGGRFCESGDVLIKDIKLPKIEAGDIIAVLCTGAYNYAMASNYNRVPRPAMVLVNGKDATLLLQRESYEDLVRNDVIL